MSPLTSVLRVLAHLRFSPSLFVQDTNDELMAIDVKLTSDSQVSVSPIPSPVIKGSDQDCACE